MAPPEDDESSTWRRSAQARIAADVRTVPPAPVVEWPHTPKGTRIFLLDESVRPSGSLKHTTMRQVFARLIAGRRLRPGHPVIFASAGNAALAGAHWCRVLGLSCVVIVPDKTPEVKKRRIEAEGARVVGHDPPAAIYDEARRLAAATSGFFLDHFEHALTATVDPGWTLAADLIDGVREAGGRAPDVLVAGLGSGATVTGLRHHGRAFLPAARIVGVDAENSAYFPGWVHDVDGYGTGMPSRIEGIGRPILPSSFDRDSVDVIVQAPDDASVAGARALRRWSGRPVGPSSGANLWVALREARQAGASIVIATVITDAHSHHLAGCHDDAWCEAKGLDPHTFAHDFAPAR